MTLAAGTRLGLYEVIAPIGKGGMGEVYRARDTKLEREVALKVLPTEMAASPERLARFQREAKALAALDHPSIVTVYSVEEADGVHFLTMQLVEGESLDRVVPDGGMSMESLLTLANALADALVAAHEKGIVHRDLKPANVMRMKDGRIKVLDFGLAKVAAPEDGAPNDSELSTAMKTSEGVVMGTVPYMSPEQVSGQAVDHRTDIFSLGVILYETATGRRPFAGPSAVELGSAILRDAPPPLTSLRPELPEGLIRVVNRCLEKDPAARFPSTRDVHHELSKVSAGGRSSGASTVDGDEKSIVVLPFENLSPDPDNEYFSDGLTDEIITDLSKIARLRVIARSSSMVLKGQDHKAVAARLGVRYVLEGSVRKAGNAVRVTAQLIDPDTSRHLWAEKYSGKLEDIFEIQEQISRQIVEALTMTLSPEEDRKLGERAIDNFEAYECYHRARQEVYKFTAEGLDRARELIETAIGIVGDNELLYASLGAVHWQYVNAAIKPDDGHIARAEELARKVFTLNPDSASGWALMGMVHQNQGRPQDALRHFKKALALDPNEFYAHLEISRLYECVGATHEAYAAYSEVLKRDPLSVINYCVLIFTAMTSGDQERAQQEGLRMLAGVPHFPMLRWLVAMSFVHGGKRDEALRILQAAPEPTPSISSQACRFVRLALEGHVDEAEACFDPDLLSRARNVEFWCMWVSECYALIGRQDPAMDWIEAAFQKGLWNYPYVARHSTTLRTLDGDPRFVDLLGRMKTAWEGFVP